MGCIPLMHDDDRIRIYGPGSVSESQSGKRHGHGSAWQVVAGAAGVVMANFITSSASRKSVLIEFGGEV
jgi:hypothetical protein